MELLSGKEVAQKIYERIKIKSTKVAIISLTDEKSTIAYLKSKVKKFSEFQIETEIINLSSNISEIELISQIENLNERKDIKGIFVEMPLPKHIQVLRVFSTISPTKDVEGLNPINLGKLIYSQEYIVPSTAKAVIELLDYYGIDVEGKRVVVIGRSLIVGKPLSLLLLNRNATVTICHSKTSNLKEIAKTADILICAIGKAMYINREYVKENSIVIDVGTNYLNNKLVGDVDFDDVKNIV
ncbi:MAG: bifunctional 5,10-methylenetetrahydrofolate dehydrogenase/5,10-methenyltetrahydrofolate cyclohydrolase, partial [candidate division WOR-3 bacterium]